MTNNPQQQRYEIPSTAKMTLYDLAPMIVVGHPTTTTTSTASTTTTSSTRRESHAASSSTQEGLFGGHVPRESDFATRKEFLCAAITEAMNIMDDLDDDIFATSPFRRQ